MIGRIDLSVCLPTFAHSAPALNRVTKFRGSGFGGRGWDVIVGIEAEIACFVQLPYTTFK